MIISESEETDRAARLEANMAYTQVRNWLEYNKDDLLPIKTGKYTGCLMMPLGIRDGSLTVRRPELRFVFMPKTKLPSMGTHQPVGGFGVGEKFNVIFFHCLIAPFDPKYLDTRMSKKTFIHEYMHHFLARLGVKDSSATSHKDGGLVAYYNNPSEINSYYHEAANEFILLLKAILQTDRADEWRRKSTKELMDFVKNVEFDKDFMEYLTPESMRVIDKRLYRFIEQTIRPMLEKAG